MDDLQARLDALSGIDSFQESKTSANFASKAKARDMSSDDDDEEDECMDLGMEMEKSNNLKAQNLMGAMFQAQAAPT